VRARLYVCMHTDSHADYMHVHIHTCVCAYVFVCKKRMSNTCIYIFMHVYVRVFHTYLSKG
jgi:hypothetical protein